jgi:hypothetical protein
MRFMVPAWFTALIYKLSYNVYHSLIFASQAGACLKVSHRGPLF